MSDKMEENCLYIHNPDGTIHSKLTYIPGKNKRLTLDKNIWIPAGTILTQGPTKIECADDCMELTIGIGKDYTAQLLISEKALNAMKKLESDVLIF